MIKASYVVTPAEFIEAQRIWSTKRDKRLPGNNLMLYAYVFLGFVVGSSVIHLPLPLAIALTLAFALVVAVPLWRKRAIRRYVADQATDRNEPVELEIDESGYFSSRPEFNECRMKWRCFTGWTEGASVFVLGRGIQLCIVPKGPLSKEQQSDLRLLLKKFLGNPK